MSINIYMNKNIKFKFDMNTTYIYNNYILFGMNLMTIKNNP